MAIEIPTALVDFILLGPTDDRRQLQDSPILGDVWAEFARRPDQRLDLLITPLMAQSAGKAATTINKRFKTIARPAAGPKKVQDPNIAYVQGIVAAKLSFEELLRVVVPITKWWADKRRKGPNETVIHDLEIYSDPKKIREILDTLLATIATWRSKLSGADREHASTRATAGPRMELSSLDRYILLAGLILWARGESAKDAGSSSADKIDEILRRLQPHGQSIGQAIEKAFAQMSAENDDATQPLIWQVSLNRTANPALSKSVPAVKADAARALFKTNCSEITWAVIDSGIDGSHPAFKNSAGECRVRKSFDFGSFRKIVSLSNSTDDIRAGNIRELLRKNELKIHFDGDDWKDRRDPEKVREDADKYLLELAEDAGRGRGAIHWDSIEKLVEIDPKTAPPSSHGTHVAGIIGANKDATTQKAGFESENFQDGMCPDINLYDFRVLGPSIEDTEFAIIGVLQYIRYLNDRDNFFTIHGANLSLSIPHDVRNFACGRTPICNECERLVEAGVVVVAAAGNHGYKSFETKDGAYDSYAAFSITDPGNADGVLTVGSTHRYWPHTYGVSFFSSRGPTGDGRLKPDLVAPGERIRAPIPGEQWGDLDGTSMAAPHVSGAAAMLLARYSELIGQPRRVKRILCDSATDLGRERSFQGHGMLDVLRAFQSI